MTEGGSKSARLVQVDRMGRTEGIQQEYVVAAADQEEEGILDL